MYICTVYALFALGWQIFQHLEGTFYLRLPRFCGKSHQCGSYKFNIPGSLWKSSLILPSGISLFSSPPPHITRLYLHYLFIRFLPSISLPCTLHPPFLFYYFPFPPLQIFVITPSLAPQSPLFLKSTKRIFVSFLWITFTLQRTSIQRSIQSKICKKYVWVIYQLSSTVQSARNVYTV
jgi:hypothetical protein